jgi:hypothetical protein
VCLLQIKCLDADMMEAQGPQSAQSAADELRSLLEGSKRVSLTCPRLLAMALPASAAMTLLLLQVGLLKTAEQEALPPALTRLAHSLGGVADGLAAAHVAVRTELQAEALPPKARALALCC